MLATFTMNISQNTSSTKFSPKVYAQLTVQAWILDYGACLKSNQIVLCHSSNFVPLLWQGSGFTGEEREGRTIAGAHTAEDCSQQGFPHVAGTLHTGTQGCCNCTHEHCMRVSTLNTSVGGKRLMKFLPSWGAIFGDRWLGKEGVYRFPSRMPTLQWMALQWMCVYWWWRGLRGLRKEFMKLEG